MPTIKEIVKEYLETNGYEGLFYPGECACELEDLMPCDEPNMNCEPGYKEPCDPKECGDHEFHISKGKL